MSGWKTKTAGIAGILFGIAGIVLHYLNGSGLGVTESFTFILSGLAVFGLADKFQKILDVLKK